MVDTGVREAWAEAAGVAVRLLASPHVAGAWNEPSVLDGMTVAILASHMGRGLLQVTWFLDAPAPPAPTVTAAEYFARLTGTTNPASTLNQGVQSRAAEVAASGPEALVAQLHDVMPATVPRVLAAPPERVIEVLHRPGEALLLDEYLRTRCVELAVHVEDLALSVGVDVAVSDATRAIAVNVLVAAARLRHGDVAVLRALARRERDEIGALRVL